MVVGVRYLQWSPGPQTRRGVGQLLQPIGRPLYDLYAEFGIEAKTVAFSFGNANTNVKNRCISVLRHIEDNLRCEFVTRVYALVSPAHGRVRWRLRSQQRWTIASGISDAMPSIPIRPREVSRCRFG